jgi:Kef-type K+ transport system membrane component KefB/voltage-gated potassium channel Kch
MEFAQIALLLVVAAIAGIFARLLKQPLLLGYLFAGFVLSYLGLVSHSATFSGLGQIGVTLLLFLLGLEMNLGDLPSIGKVALITGLGQIVATVSLGFLLSLGLGLPILPAAYISVALTFSSTIVIIKLLSEKKDLGSLYGKISIGLLLIQDLVAIIVLMFLSGLGREVTASSYGLIFVKGLILIIATWVLSKKILPAIFDKFLSSSSELLFISSIAWALGVAALVGGPLGFTLEIGGFMAGLALSGLPEHLQIATKARPLRDFFLAIFFIVLGTQLVIGNFAVILFPVVALSLFVILIDPLIVLIILGLLGYSKRTALYVGLTMTQISEFSLILVAMGKNLGHINDTHVSIVVLVGIITMTVSTYLIMGADKIYKHVKKYIGIFERGKSKETALNTQKEMDDHVVLVGAGRTGRTVMNFLIKRKIPFVVLDFNPGVFTKLTAENIPVILGDGTDEDILELSALSKAKLLISTTSDIRDNQVILEIIKGFHFKPTTIFTSASREDGLLLYEKGADYVLVPHTVGGEHIRHLIATYGVGSDRIKKLGKASFNRLMNS